MTHRNVAAKLDDLYAQLRLRRETYLGYPNNVLLDNSNLSKFLDLTINNVGDPFVGNNGMNTFELEREVLEFFAELLRLPRDDFWGYLTNGGTEGNLYGLYLGREIYPNGVIYYSEDTHYSIPKAVRLLGARGAVIRSREKGEIDYDHLRVTLDSMRHYPAIINANVGTTMKGAIDDVSRILELLDELKIQRFHVHCDAALFGAMLPFYPEAPPFDFRLPIGSIAISGHKFLGSPIPCGVVLARKHLVENIRSSVEYIGSNDTTISGSRDGFSVLILWQALMRHGREGLADMVRSCETLTKYAMKRLFEIDWPAWVNPFSNIIVIRRPQPELVRKWQLASERNIAHLIVMPGVTAEMIDDFIEDLVKTRIPQKDL